MLRTGSGSGSIKIPPETNSGEHIIRSYTSWMRNFGPDAFHYTPVLIIHPAKKYSPRYGEKEIRDTANDSRRPSRVKIAEIQVSGLKKDYLTRESLHLP